MDDSQEDRILYPESDYSLIRYGTSPDDEINVTQRDEDEDESQTQVPAFVQQSATNHNNVGARTLSTTDQDHQDESETQIPIQFQHPPRDLVDPAFTTPCRPSRATKVVLPEESPLPVVCEKCKSNEFTKQCFAPDCSRLRCAQCVLALCRKNSQESLKDEDGDLIHVCTKKCYDKSKTMLGSDRILWTRDGKGGPDDPNTSMSILLDWLMAEGNYTKYRGGPTSNGKGKLFWAAILSNRMKEAGVRKYRSPKAIKNKIIVLEDSFKQAHDWAGQTGAGVRENDPRHFDDYVLKKCPYYFNLLDIMQDRSTSRPQLTSDNLIRMFRSHGNLAFHIPIVCSLITRADEREALKFSCSRGRLHPCGFLYAGIMVSEASKAESPNRYSTSVKKFPGDVARLLLR